ncbi:hypothetical protein DEU56DRAFT_901085 [Suillus clintonianus]|uniref:uncharacterized protein n=1 Tax=Suillus clintonianus TaxID=1904413 RepID=UPI001B882B7C|nr:uncharacterized protein DEU56DRAFT_901085 [Suillus clintonianus]KAG2139248.1 hypothetical protein DEU56DRAFT_901085 [Suillus clintonianus]
MSGSFPIVDNTAGVYDVITHLDEEIDYIMRSRSIFVKAIFILCRYLPFVIGAVRIYEVVGEGYIDDNFCLVLMRSSIWLSFLQMACVEFIFILRTYALWGCSKRVLICLLTAYLATYVTGLVSLQMYTGALPAGRFNPHFNTEACYGSENPGALWLLVSFVALISLEIGLFVMSMHRVLRQYRAASGQLLKSLVRNNIVYFGASVALNILNIVGILLIPVATWPTGIMEIAQILFQGLLATRMQLDLWKVDRRRTTLTMVTMSMAEFAAARAESTVYQSMHYSRKLILDKACRIWKFDWNSHLRHSGFNRWNVLFKSRGNVRPYIPLQHSAEHQVIPQRRYSSPPRPPAWPPVRFSRVGEVMRAAGGTVTGLLSRYMHIVDRSHQPRKLAAKCARNII